MFKNNTKSIDAKQIEKQFYNFLDKYKVTGKGVPYTHTSFGSPWSKWDIPDSELDEFYDIYVQTLGKVVTHITERPKNVGPLLLDLDFNFTDNDGERKYTEKEIEYIICLTNTTIKKYYDVNSLNLKAYVFEKNEPTHKDKKLYKDGFHIVYPYMAMSIPMRFLVIHEVMMKTQQTKGFIHIPFTNSYNDVFDKSIVENNGWMLFGSRKHDGYYYFLTHIYKQTLAEEDVEKCVLPTLVKLFSNRKYGDDDETPYRDDIDASELEELKAEMLATYSAKAKTKSKNINSYVNTYYDDNKDSDDEDTDDEDTDNENSEDDSNDEIEGENSDDEQQLTEPYDDQDFCEVDPLSKKSSKKSDKKSKNKNNDVDAMNGEEYKEIRNKLQEKVEDKRKKGKLSDKKMAERLVAIMSRKRATEYESWLHVCWALKATSPKLLPAFKKFSQKTKKKNYDEKTCEKFWERARDQGFTISSLHYWAKHDNPEQYAELMRDSVYDLLEMALSKTEYDIAKVIFELYKYTFKCSSISHSTWYEFQKHRWVQVQKGYTLYMKISEDLTKEFAQMNAYIYAKAAAINARDRDEIFKKGEAVKKVIDDLKKSGPKGRIMSECEKLFYDPEFEEKLDNKRDLIGFNNGVYDLKNGCFRAGTPDDFVTLTTGHNYEEFTMDHEYIQGINKFMGEVQTEEDMREYILRLLSSYLDGHTKKQQFIIWTGSGCHAKGTKIMMHDGSLKNVEDIKIGEKLMGDDSKPRNVKRLCRGNSIMYKITPVKGDPYIVNDKHILCLKRFNNDETLEISVERFCRQYEHYKDYKGYRINLKDCSYQVYDFKFEKLEVDNYYGFELDANNRYVMGDFTITHNSNGKSTLVEFFQLAFGEYCGVLPITVLTRKRGSSGAATPELASTRGKRFVVFQEPENDDQIYVGYMKELTGGDWIYARKLFGDPFRFKPQFKLLMTCNKLPYIPSTDGGTWRRLRVSPYDSEFIDGKPKGPKQFKKDYDLMDKLEEWKSALMWYLLNVYYPKYKKTGLEEPEKVKIFTKKYKKASDFYLEFIEENLLVTEKKADFESLDIVFTAFKNWYNESYSTRCPVNKKELQDYLEKNNYKVGNGYIFGVKFKCDDKNAEKFEG